MMAILNEQMMSAYVNRLLVLAESDDSPLGLVDGAVRMDGLTGSFDLIDDEGNVLEVTVRPRGTGWQAEWELVGRDGDGNAVLKHKETGGRYRIIPEEDL